MSQNIVMHHHRTPKIDQEVGTSELIPCMWSHPAGLRHRPYISFMPNTYLQQVVVFARNMPSTKEYDMIVM